MEWADQEAFHSIPSPPFLHLDFFTSIPFAAWTSFWGSIIIILIIIIIITTTLSWEVVGTHSAQCTQKRVLIECSTLVNEMSPLLSGHPYDPYVNVQTECYSICSIGLASFHLSYLKLFCKCGSVNDYAYPPRPC